jgi:hypothetical protein
VGHPIHNPTDKVADIVHLLAHPELYVVRRCVEQGDVCMIHGVSADSGTGDSQSLHLLWAR